MLYYYYYCFPDNFTVHYFIYYKNILLKNNILLLTININNICYIINNNINCKWTYSDKFAENDAPSKLPIRDCLLLLFYNLLTLTSSTKDVGGD